MEQLLPHAFQEVPDGLLSDAILKVGIDSTKCELLPCVVACLLEGFVRGSGPEFPSIFFF
jgi:hypothetical protein